MTKLLTKFASVLASLALVLTMVPASAFADDGSLAPTDPGTPVVVTDPAPVDPSTATTTDPVATTTGTGSEGPAAPQSEIQNLSVIAPLIAVPVNRTWYVNTSVAASGNGMSTSTAFKTIEEAVSASISGDTIDMTGTETVAGTLSINKDITIDGQNSSTLNTSGGSYLFLISGAGAGATIENFSIDKTDSADQNIVGIQSNNVTISGNTFLGTFNIGGSQVSRALEVSTVSGLLVSNNHITHLRQPAYINDGASGTVSGNYVSDTKGWVVLSDSNVSFTGNTWGTNVDDIAIIAGPSDSAMYADLMAISHANSNGFIIDKFGVLPRQTAAWVSAVSGNDANDGSSSTPLATISNALSRVVAGATVHVNAGSYVGPLTITKNGITVVGTGSVTVTETVTDSFGYGATVDNASGVSITGIGFVSAIPSGYAFHAFKADNLTLSNLSFTGPGKTSTHIGGIDVNTSKNVAITNVSSTGFYKNGFAFTSQYGSTDTAADGITLSGITSSDNGWTGIAFYTVGNDHSPVSVGGSASFSNVKFLGANTIANNGTGIFVEGDSDAKYNANSTTTAPANTVTSDGTTLDIGSVAFSGNTKDFVNFQAAPVTATSATFGGQTGAQMDATARAAEDAKITDHNDNPKLGLVTYFPAPSSNSGNGNDNGNGRGVSGGGGGGGGGNGNGNNGGGNGGNNGGNGTGGQVLGAATFNFTRDLHIGMRGADVKELQTELIAAGYSIPAGATGYFGPQTRAAVAKWQADNGISPAAGYFGPISRAKYAADGSFHTAPAH